MKIVVKDEFNKQINGFRFLPCVAILIFHFIGRYSQIQTGGSINPFLYSLSYFVYVFLFMSGYFLYYTNFCKFWFKKIINLYIPYLFALILLFIVNVISGSSITVVDLLANATIIPMLFGKFKYIDGAHWYIVDLFLFFIIFSLIKFISDKLKKSSLANILLVIFSLISLILSFFEEKYIIIKAFKSLFSTKYLFIIFGYLLREFFYKKDACSKLIFAIQTIILLLDVIFNISDYLFVLIFALSLIIFILCLFKKMKIFEIEIFQIIGESSLMIYLLHQTLGYAIINLFGDKLKILGILFAFIASISIGIIFSKVYKKIKIKLLNNSFLKKTVQN